MKTEFFDAYSEAKLFRNHVFFRLFILTVLVAVLWAYGDRDGFVLLMLTAFCGYLIVSVSFHSWFFKIVGKDNMITVLDEKTMLVPGESVRTLRYPRFVHTIPLQEELAIDFNIGNLKSFHDLEEFLVECDVPDLETKAFRVVAALTWKIPTGDMVRANNVLLHDQFLFVLMDDIRRRTAGVMKFISDSRFPCYPPTLQTFTKQVRELLEMSLLRNRRFSSLPGFISVQIVYFTIELVSIRDFDTEH